MNLSDFLYILSKKYINIFYIFYLYLLSPIEPNNLRAFWYACNLRTVFALLNEPVFFKVF